MHAGNDLALTVDQFHLPRLLQRLEVLGKVGPARPLIRVRSGFVFAGLDEIAGIRKGGNYLVAFSHRVSPAMIRVEMGVRHGGHVLAPDVLLSRQRQESATVKALEQ